MCCPIARNCAFKHYLTLAISGSYPPLRYQNIYQKLVSRFIMCSILLWIKLSRPNSPNLSRLDTAPPPPPPGDTSGFVSRRTFTRISSPKNITHPCTSTYISTVINCCNNTFSTKRALDVNRYYKNQKYLISSCLRPPGLNIR
jgi:hypothetical protein